MIALVDGDIVCYRVAAKLEDEEDVDNTMSSFCSSLMLEVDAEDFEWFLTGKGNFRYAVAKTAPYKGNRKGEKPTFLPACREWLVEHCSASVSVDEEADDLIAIRATEVPSIIVSLDKDFQQVPGWHYNFVKKVKNFVTPEEGLLFFYKQILMGDSADNIKGVGGVGPVKAAKLLDKAKDEAELYRRCVVALGEERVLENGRLLWLRRKPLQMWEPPV